MTRKADVLTFTIYEEIVDVEEEYRSIILMHLMIYILKSQNDNQIA